VVDCSAVADDVESFGSRGSEAASGINALPPVGDVAATAVAGSSRCSLFATSDETGGPCVAVPFVFACAFASDWRCLDFAACCSSSPRSRVFVPEPSIFGPSGAPSASSSP
jgi:hypothetical protein